MTEISPFEFAESGTQASGDSGLEGSPHPASSLLREKRGDEVRSRDRSIGTASEY